MKHPALLPLLVAPVLLTACARDSSSGSAGNCGPEVAMAGTCDVTEELSPSDLELEEIPYLCHGPQDGAAELCAEQPGVECFFEDAAGHGANVFVFSSSEAVIALVGEECLEVPFDIDWSSERIVAGGLSDGTCGCAMEQARLVYSYPNDALHLDLYMWDSCNPWNEEPDCASDTPASTAVRIPTAVNPTVCLYKNPPCAE